MKRTLLSVGCLLLMGWSWQVAAFDKDDMKKFLATKICKKCDLSGADLAKADLAKADLTQATLQGVNLAGANLSGANLTKADFNTANLEGANLEGANLANAYLFATRNSIIFIISIIAIAGAVLLEINNTTIEKRYNVLVNHTKRMKTLGITILLLSIIGSLLATESFLAIGTSIGLFLTARFPIAFAAIMFLQSAFLRVPFTKKPKEEKMIITKL